MWKVLPKIALIKILLAGFAAMFLAAFILLFEPSTGNINSLTEGDFWEALKLATPVTLTFIAVVYVMGKWAWRLFWKVPYLGSVLNKHVCPDLNGQWSGQIESNFIDKDRNRTQKDVELEIQADFFGISICQKSLDRYQSSKVVQSEIYKDPRTNSFYVSYIFEANVPLPMESDDRSFEGSGKLEVIFDKELIRLEGTYWTNRAWQRRLNTAGIIKLTRKNN